MLLTDRSDSVILDPMTENKAKIGVSIDQSLLERIDRLCELRNEARSAFFERVLSGEIDGEERFMAGLENPLVRGIVRAIVESPGVLEVAAKVARADLAPGELEGCRENLPELIDAAKQNKQIQKGVADGTAKLGSA